MTLYHFSNKFFEVGDQIPIGHFKVTVSKANNIVQEFECLMEERRLIVNPNAISRLNCLFTFPNNVAEGFKTDREFLYELKLPKGVNASSHNHEIGTYFSKLFHLNDIDFIKDELNLIDNYWTNTRLVSDSNGIKIDHNEEILVGSSLEVLRRIKLK